MKTHVEYLILFLILFITSCGSNVYYESRKLAIQSSVDNVRAQLSAKLNKPVPSISVYIQAPEGTWFVSSADSPAERLTEKTYFRFAAIQKHLRRQPSLKCIRTAG